MVRSCLSSKDEAIANKNNVPGKLELYVPPFSSRPVLHVKDIQGNRQPYALTYIDAIMRFGDTLEEGDLGEAYVRAGNHFRRQLSQTFVVLKEDKTETRLPHLQSRGRGAPRARGTYRGRGFERGRGGYNRGGHYQGQQASEGGSGLNQNQGQKRSYENPNQQGTPKRGYGVQKRS